MRIKFQLLILGFLVSALPVMGGRDHAPIHGPRSKMSAWNRVVKKFGVDRRDYTHHESAAEDFKDRYFRDERTHAITLQKTQQFLYKLQNEFRRNRNKVYETEFLEQLDVVKTNAKKAEQRAQVADVDHNILRPYDLYLFPKLNEMISALKRQEPNDVVEGILDDFIRGYIPYFNPNPFNNIFKTKVNVLGGIVRIVKSPTIKYEDKKAQANNLLVENEAQRNEINKILMPHATSVRVGDFLTQDSIDLLLNNNFDISTLNPGDSAFWEPLSPQDKKMMYDVTPDIFPDNDTKKTFKSVMLGGANSYKVKLIYQDSKGVKRHVKLKVGDEVYEELASAALMKLMGFTSDKMVHAGTVKFYLGNKTFENFEAEVRQKFQQSYNVRYNFERGVDENGERFITWRDTLYEGRPDDEIRIAPFDIASWDLSNRREYRGKELAYAWLGLMDLKSDNLKALIVKKGNRWVPKHRIHDVGVSLGPSLVFTGPKSILNLPAAYGKVNELESKIVKKKKDGVVIRWNDFCYQHRVYNSSTYYDQKWMARKIASIAMTDIQEAFSQSGMHPDLAHLYAIKMAMRRNNIVKAFDLTDEYGLLEVPKDLSKYTPPEHPSIINGRILVTAYEGKNGMPIRTRTWWTLVDSILHGQNIPKASLLKGKNDHKFTGQMQVGAVELGYEWKKEKKKFGPFDSALLENGVTLIPSRRVIENQQNLNTFILDKHNVPKVDDSGRALRTHLPYLVEDKIKIVVAVKGEFKKSSILPLYGEAGVKFVEKYIVHRHFAESVKKGWLSPFKLVKIVFHGMKKFAAENLNDLEMIESYYSLGVDIDIKAGTEKVDNNVALGGSGRKFHRRILHRDQFGRLHYLTEKMNKKNIYGSIGIIRGDFKLFDIAALDVALSKEGYRGEVHDYLIGVTDKTALQTHDHPLRDNEQIRREMQAFKDLKKDPKNAEVILNFGRKYTGGSSDKRLGLAFVFGRETLKHWGQIEDSFINGQMRKLFQATIYSGKHLGKKDIWDFNDVIDIAVKKGKSQKTIVEAELRAPEKFIVTVNNKVFTRKTNRKGLLALIKKLNARYTDNYKANYQDQFMADLELPSKEEQNKYRKIYAEVKTQVDGEYFLQKMRTMTAVELEAILTRFFEEEAITVRKARFDFADDGAFVEKTGTAKRKTRAANAVIGHFKRKKIIAQFNKLKSLLDSEEINDDYWRNVLLASRDLVHDLSSKYYGIHILKEVLNNNADQDELNKGLLVYGEIRNIGDHITSLERPHGHHANLRNAGRHWGEFNFGKDKVRPVQYFLKYEDPTGQVPVYTPLLIGTSKLLGRLEQGQPPNFSGEGI